MNVGFPTLPLMPGTKHLKHGLIISGTIGYNKGDQQPRRYIGNET